MVDRPTPTGETLREIAARHGRAYNTLRTVWSRHPDWPEPIGKRGRSYVYDSAAVDKVVAEHFARDAVELEPLRLYTARQIAEATGISAATIRADQAKTRADGTPRWPAPDDTSGPANRWYGKTISHAFSKRRNYQQKPL
ncbi:hypothetical protein GCM10011583_11840 [Streptomyces camponoticapitis]|uniref:HTH merR-type domain-containing protein n=1 Tax=Streptomyces camponoticapitis TaxID=1616125 RepID=A0ABQ2E0K6_9ACTN|nr:hypothetical protein [Streptomyces camponoticapitis]GGJ81975.1 hypothetical protein GCM10011583_11840 [Streptomyces camponoticapitis]